MFYCIGLFALLEENEQCRNTRGKSFCKTRFEVGMDLQKVQKQGRDGKMQEDYPTSEQWQKRKTRTLPYICCYHTADVG